MGSGHCRVEHMTGLHEVRHAAAVPAIICVVVQHGAETQASASHQCGRRMLGVCLSRSRRSPSVAHGQGAACAHTLSIVVIERPTLHLVSWSLGLPQPCEMFRPDAPAKDTMTTK